MLLISLQFTEHNHTPMEEDATEECPNTTDSIRSTKWVGLKERLGYIYKNDHPAEQELEGTNQGSFLLSKLVESEHLNTLVVNLYPGTKGYSLMVNINGQSLGESICLPYEDTEFLDCLDRAEIPHTIVDLLDGLPVNLFHEGCVICEVRDYRSHLSGGHSVRYVLLQPSSQSIQVDLENLTNDGTRWTVDDRLALESQILEGISEPLCLDPSNKAFDAMIKTNNKHGWLDRPAIVRNCRRYSQLARNRQAKLAENQAPPALRLYDFITKAKDRAPKKKRQLQIGSNVYEVTCPFCTVWPETLNKTAINNFKTTDVHLDVPQSLDEVKKYAKSYSWRITADNTLAPIEDYIFETDCGGARLIQCRLTIWQRLSDDRYIGQLYMDNFYVPGQSRGRGCRFSFGTRAEIERFVHQFSEIYSNEGRFQVKVTRQVPGDKASTQPSIKQPPVPTAPNPVWHLSGPTLRPAQPKTEAAPNQVPPDILSALRQLRPSIKIPTSLRVQGSGAQLTSPLSAFPSSTSTNPLGKSLDSAALSSILGSPSSTLSMFVNRFPGVTGNSSPPPNITITRGNSMPSHTLTVGNSQAIDNPSETASQILAACSQPSVDQTRQMLYQGQGDSARMAGQGQPDGVRVSSHDNIQAILQGIISQNRLPLSQLAHSGQDQPHSTGQDRVTIVPLVSQNNTSVSTFTLPASSIAINQLTPGAPQRSARPSSQPLPPGGPRMTSPPPQVQGLPHGLPGQPQLGSLQRPPQGQLLTLNQPPKAVVAPVQLLGQLDRQGHPRVQLTQGQSFTINAGYPLNSLVPNPNKTIPLAPRQGNTAGPQFQQPANMTHITIQGGRPRPAKGWPSHLQQ